jgi:hypothetical protein
VARPGYRGHSIGESDDGERAEAWGSMIEVDCGNEGIV